MPRFYDEQNPALNSFRKVNTEVVKRGKKKYAGEKVTPAQQGLEDPRATGLFEGLTEALSSLYATVSEIYNTLSLQSLRGANDNVIIDRFVGTSVITGKRTRDLKNFFTRRLKRSFNMFTPSQVDEIAQYVANIGGENDNIEDKLDDLAQRTTRPATQSFIENISETLDRNYSVDLVELLSIMQDALTSYKQGLSGQGEVGEVEVGAGRKRVIKCGGRGEYTTLPIRNRTPIGLPNPFYRLPDMPNASHFRKIGGAELYSKEPVLKGGSPASYRVGIDKSANPYTHLGRLAPRNTHDLRDLPRRFL